MPWQSVQLPNLMLSSQQYLPLQNIPPHTSQNHQGMQQHCGHSGRHRVPLHPAKIHPQGSTPGTSSHLPGDGIHRKGPPRKEGVGKGRCWWICTQALCWAQASLLQEGRAEHHPRSHGKQRANEKQEQTARCHWEPQIPLKTLSETTEAGQHARFPFPWKKGNVLLLQSRTKAKCVQIFCYLNLK